MRKYMILLAALALVSCAKEQNNPEEVIPQEPETGLQHITFTGITDDGLTKTTLGDGYSIIWSTDDDISVFPGASADGVKFDCTATNRGGLEATFSGDASASATYYALSPAQGGAKIADGKITASLPTTQTATSGSYAPEANISVATANDYVFQFKNVGALVQVTIDQDDITGIKLEAIGGEQLSGSVTINPADGEITSRNGGESYVQLTGTFIKDNTYYFIILPGIYSQGFRITLNKGTQYASFKKGDSKGIGRNDNFDFGTIHGEKWKTAFKLGDKLDIVGSAESGSDPYYLSYVGSEGYWNPDITYSDVTDYAYNYEIFTSLSESQPFYFHSEGDEYFTLNADGNAVERLTKKSDASYSVTATGIYRIRLNMTDGTAEIKQISEVKYDLYGLDSRKFNNYQGHGVWSADNFLMRTDVDSHGYRFLVKFTDDSKQYYGRMSSKTDNPTYGTTSEDYFFLQPSTDQNESHWAASFKYESTYAVTQNRYYCTMTLSFNNDNGHYTHAITNIWDKEKPIFTGEAVRVYGSAVASPDSPGVQMRYSTSFYNSDVANSGDRVDASSTMADPVGYDYEIFVKLSKDTKFYFSTESGHHFGINSTGDGIEGIFAENEVGYSGVSNDGVYRIRINSSNGAVALKRAESARYLQPARGINQELSYIGNGTWRGYPLFGWYTSSPEGVDNKSFMFKFQIYFNEHTTWQYYGRYETASTYTSNHLQPITDTGTTASWDNFITVEGDPNLAKTEYQTNYGYCDMYLKLNAEGYTYQITSIRK